jgi:hypothetical protein
MPGTLCFITLKQLLDLNEKYPHFTDDDKETPRCNFLKVTKIVNGTTEI